MVKKRGVGKENGKIILLNETSLDIQTHQKIIGNRLLDQFSFATTYVLFHHPHILRVWVENKDILVLNTEDRPLSSSNMLYSPPLPQCLYSAKQYETGTYICKAWERLFYAKYLLGKILPSTYMYVYGWEATQVCFIGLLFMEKVLLNTAFTNQSSWGLHAQFRTEP